MNDHPPDLLALIAEARGLVPDDRHIWCSASDVFESRLAQRRGLLLGGALSPHFLRTLIVNTLRATLPVCVVRPPRDRHGNPAPGMASLAQSCATPPNRHDQLPRLAEVWIRRTATALFPSADEAALPAAGLQNFAVVETGGENHEDQYDRLRFLMKELQRSGGG